MLALSAKIRKELGKKVKALRKKGVLPGVLYGPKIKPLALEINQKDFEKAYQEAGESSLLSLEVDRPEGKPSASYGAGKKFLVLVHDVKRDPLNDRFIHVDFYQPDLEKEVEARVPIIFEGEAPAIKELGGTFVRSISEVEVKALPQKLPKEIKVDTSRLRTFEDHILIKDLPLPEGVKVLKEQDEIVAYVAQPEKVEEELEKPIEEKVEEVEMVEKPAKEKVEEEPVNE